MQIGRQNRSGNPIILTVLPEEVATNKVITQSTLNSEVTNQQKSQLWQDIARKGSNRGVCV